MMNKYSNRLLFPVWLALLLLGATLAQAAVTPVRLVTGNVALSVWDTDPTMFGAALQIRNAGTGEAGDIQVNSIVIQSGSYEGPAAVPFSLGTVDPGEDAILNIRLKVPKTDGTRYLLTISGRYTYLGKVYGFSLNRFVAPQPSANGPFQGKEGVSTIQNPLRAVYPPEPRGRPFEPNAETPMLIPVGPLRQIFPPTPTSTPAQTTPAGDLITIPINTSQQNAGVPPDPNAGAEGHGVVLSTFNTGISYSLDGGTSFTNVNLFLPQPSNPSRTSFFPQDDGGLCCDQVVIYIPQRNIFVWLLQYWPVTTCTANCGTGTPTTVISTPNRLRIAWATPEAIRADFWNAWSYCDLTANNRAGVSDGLGTANNEWLDYPDLAFSNTFLYVGIDHGFPTPGQVYTGRRIVARLSLNDMVDTSASVVHYNFAEYTGVNGLNKDHFVQGAPGRMVLGALQDQSTFKVFSWRDDQGSPAPAQTIPVSSITTDYTSAAPDGSDWYAVSFPGNVTGATYRQVIQFGDNPSREEYLFAFDAGRNTPGGRAQPYVRIETLALISVVLPPFGTFDIFTSFAEYDVWNSDYAFAMAALGTQQEEIGLALAVGGGTLGYPQFSVGFKNDFVVFLVTGSDATQVSRFGDYLPARPIAGSSDFATEVYDVLQNVSGQICAVGGCRAVMRYVRFGRPPVIIR